MGRVGREGNEDGIQVKTENLSECWKIGMMD